MAGHAHAANAEIETIAHSCAGCHGTRGNGHRSLPAIRGMDRNQFVEAMRGFKNDHRTATVMGRIARGFSEAELLKLADYFSESH